MHSSGSVFAWIQRSTKVLSIHRILTCLSPFYGAQLVRFNLRSSVPLHLDPSIFPHQGWSAGESDDSGTMLRRPLPCLMDADPDRLKGKLA